MAILKKVFFGVVFFICPSSYISYTIYTLYSQHNSYNFNLMLFIWHEPTDCYKIICFVVY